MSEIGTIHERMKKLVNLFADGKNTVFAQRLGVSEANIRSYIRGVLPKADILKSIVTSYDVNADWLLTGRGCMEIDPPPPRQKTPPRPYAIPDQQKKSYSTEAALIAMIRDRDNLLLDYAQAVGQLRALLRRADPAALAHLAPLPSLPLPLGPDPLLSSSLPLAADGSAAVPTAVPTAATVPDCAPDAGLAPTEVAAAPTEVADTPTDLAAGSVPDPAASPDSASPTP